MAGPLLVVTKSGLPFSLASGIFLPAKYKKYKNFIAKQEKNDRFVSP